MYSNSSSCVMRPLSGLETSSSGLAPYHKPRIKDVLNSSDVTGMYAKLPENAYVFGTVLNDSSVLLQLMSQFGGCTVRIPKRWPPRKKTSCKRQHPLQEVLSPAQMHQIVAHFGGTEVYIPKCTRYMAEVRNAQIIQSFSHATRQGASSVHMVQRLARQYALSDRRIWDILKKSITTQNIKADGNCLSEMKSL